MKGLWSRATGELSALDPIDRLTQLTALALIIYTVFAVIWPKQLYFAGAVIAAACTGVLIAPGLRHNRWVWWVIVAAQLPVFVLAWRRLDNHNYLFLYWTLAVALAAHAPEGLRRAVMARAAAALIGLAMLFAVLQKLRYPEFWSGDFLHYAFLMDDRFAFVGELLGVDLAAAITKNRGLVGLLLADPGRDTIVLTGSTGGLAALAKAVSVTTVAFEAALAVVIHCALGEAVRRPPRAAHRLRVRSVHRAPHRGLRFDPVRDGPGRRPRRAPGPAARLPIISPARVLLQLRAAGGPCSGLRRPGDTRSASCRRRRDPV